MYTCLNACYTENRRRKVKSAAEAGEVDRPRALNGGWLYNEWSGKPVPWLTDWLYTVLYRSRTKQKCLIYTQIWLARPYLPTVADSFSANSPFWGRGSSKFWQESRFWMPKLLTREISCGIWAAVPWSKKTFREKENILRNDLGFGRNWILFYTIAVFLTREVI